MGIKVTPQMYEQLPANPVDMLLVTFDSQGDIAAFCSVTDQAVSNWKSRISIPYWYAEDLSRHTGIPVWMLCPKHFQKGEDVADSTEHGQQGDGEGREVPTKGSD